MANRSANVVVIGGGVNGTSIAMHLARMGAGKVLLLEKGHLAGGASGRSGAMVREHYFIPRWSRWRWRPARYSTTSMRSWARRAVY